MVRVTRIVVAALLTVGGLQVLLAGPALAVPMNDSVMTGNVPACAAQLASFDPSPVFTNATTAAGYGHLGTMQQKGLLNNCINMNYQDPNNPSSFPKGASTSASPSTFPINNQPQTVVLNMSGASAAGPFNTDYPSCMPLSTRSGGCTNPIDYTGNPYTVPDVAYRLANSSGQFIGPWTLAGLPGSPNPYFDLTRGSCPDRNPGWTPGSYSQLGFPCTWELNFVTDVNGKPNLTKAMQVVIAANGDGGSQTSGGVTSPAYTVESAISLLFTTGGSSSLKLAASQKALNYGKKFALTATVKPAPSPAATVRFYSTAAGRTRSLLGTATTNSQGVATLGVKPQTTAVYTAYQVADGAETSKSSPVTVGVKPKTKLTARGLIGAGYEFTATVAPDSAILQARLQRKVGGKWKTVRASTAKYGEVSFIETAPEGGASSYRIAFSKNDQFLACTTRTLTVYN